MQLLPVMVRGVRFLDNVQYVVNESQYTGPANQSEAIASGKLAIWSTRSFPGGPLYNVGRPIA